MNDTGKRKRRLLALLAALVLCMLFCGCALADGSGPDGTQTTPSGSPGGGESTAPVFVDHPAAEPGVDGMTLTFSDEFEGASLDESKWTYEKESWSSSNGAVQKYRNANVSVSGGALNISVLNKNDALSEADRGKYVTSGSVKTTGKFSQTYGRFEARMRIPTYVGAWPGFWMMPSDPNCNGGGCSGWPYNGEIDIMEGKGRLNTRVSGTLHTAYNVTNANNANKSVGKEYYTAMNAPVDRWHLYALIWTPDSISFEVDGAVYQTIEKEEWTTDYYRKFFASRPSAPFDQPFYITFSCGVGGIWDNNRIPDLDTFGPALMTVDYFRVYQFNDYL